MIAGRSPRPHGAARHVVRALLCLILQDSTLPARVHGSIAALQSVYQVLCRCPNPQHPSVRGSWQGPAQPTDPVCTTSRGAQMSLGQTPLARPAGLSNIPTNKARQQSGCLSEWLHLVFQMAFNPPFLLPIPCDGAQGKKSSFLPCSSQTSRNKTHQTCLSLLTFQTHLPLLAFFSFGVPRNCELEHQNASRRPPGPPRPPSKTDRLPSTLWH